MPNYSFVLIPTDNSSSIYKHKKDGILKLGINRPRKNGQNYYLFITNKEAVPTKYLNWVVSNGVLKNMSAEDLVGTELILVASSDYNHGLPLIPDELVEEFINGNTEIGENVGQFF